MKLPYKARIMIALDGQEPVEALRLQRPLATSDIRHVIDGLSAGWRWWIEKTMPRSHEMGRRGRQ